MPLFMQNYLENQTEAIVHSITALLAAIRGGAQPIKLQENLSQIITIVSSIVQILRDNLPSHLQDESESTIQELSTNCQKLIDLQNSTEGASQTFSKQTKQAMATASFGVAKSLKGINSLLSSA
jgi:methionyl-tRNA synthetase